MKVLSDSECNAPAKVSECNSLVCPSEVINENWGEPFKMPSSEPDLSATEAYRFSWRSSFDGKAVIDIRQIKDSMIVRSWLARSRLQSPAEIVKDCSPADWAGLQRALLDSRFWSLPPHDDRIGLDGAWWTIEGYLGNRYHSVERWCPPGGLRKLGKLFFAIAGSHFASVELY
jgi:hypothetical protein